MVVDPPPSPIPGDTASTEATTSYRDPNIPDPRLTPVPSIVSSLTPDVPEVPGGTYGGLSVPASPDTSADDTSGNIAGLFNQADPQYQGLLADDRQAVQNKIMVEGSILRDMDRRDSDYSRRMEDMYNAQM